MKRKPRTFVRMCQWQFVFKIKDGTKDCTVRADGKQKIRVGDRLDLRAWSGKAYRSKQEKLLVVTVSRIRKIRIRKAAIILGGKSLNLYGPDGCHALAIRDGFSSAYEFTNFFRDNHGLPFKGRFIEWKA